MAVATAEPKPKRRRTFSLPFKVTRRGALSVMLIAFGAIMFLYGPGILNYFVQERPIPEEFVVDGDVQLAEYLYSVETTLTLEPVVSSLDDVPHIVIPALTYMQVTGVIFLISGILGLFAPTRLRRFATIMMIISGILVIPTFMIVAAAGSSTNITTIFSESLRLATPIAIGAMAGIWSERSGIVNIAIEGMMLFGACAGFTTVFFLLPQSPNQQGEVLFIAVLVAVLAGGVAALLHAWLSITFSTDQIVSGTVINILAVGVTSFIRREWLISTEGGTITLPNVAIPILSDIPIIGDPLFNNQPIFYMMFVVIAITHLMLFYTRFGIRMRSVGEHPSAADSLGIKVTRIRWRSVFISGLIAGLAGAWFSLEATGRFNDSMTRGTGFIALAAVIFGKWTPLGAFGGALLFGFSNALGTRFQIIDVPIPVQFLQMVPYIVTIVVLAGFIGRAFPPKALGQPYKKE